MQRLLGKGKNGKDGNGMIQRERLAKKATAKEKLNHVTSPQSQKKDARMDTSAQDTIGC